MLTLANSLKCDDSRVDKASSPQDSNFLDEFTSFVGSEEFPCIGAKAAINSGAYTLCVYDELASPASSEALAVDLQEFMDSAMRRASNYATFISIFRQPGVVSEEAFEHLLWTQLQQLHQIDALRHSWDSSVSSDPTDSHFSFSFAGEALYVVGMHPGSSRLSRRFRWPALVFNPHGQFERLRQEGNWERMQSTIRSRDFKLQGSTNLMLANFGEKSEARQYSGRAVADGWSPPFKAVAAKPKGKCPFGWG